MAHGTLQYARWQTASEQAIKLAGGNTEADWLSKNLTVLLDALAQKYKIECERPKKSELRKELERFNQAAELIRKSLHKIAVVEYINLVTKDWLRELWPVIFVLTRYADAARIAAENIPSTAGATRAKGAENLLGSKPWCALIVRELWQTCQSRYPGDTNEHAQEAANLMWAAVLGKQSGLKAESWAPHFRSARKCKDWQVEYIKMCLNLRPPELKGLKARVHRGCIPNWHDFP